MLGKTRRLRLCLARNSWIGRRKACITSVCMRGTTMSRLWWWTVSRIRNSMMAGRMCWLCRFPARWFHWPPCVLGRGADPWFGTFAESTDLCRRICLGGGRVVVVPQARIAHRRARFEGVRSKNGQPVEDEEGRVDPYLAVREANTKYAYTDVHRSWWPLLWIWSILKALGLAVLCLTRKQPYHGLLRIGPALAFVAPLAGRMEGPVPDCVSRVGSP